MSNLVLGCLGRIRATEGLTRGRRAGRCASVAEGGRSETGKTGHGGGRLPFLRQRARRIRWGGREIPDPKSLGPLPGATLFFSVDRPTIMHPNPVVVVTGASRCPYTKLCMICGAY